MYSLGKAFQLECMDSSSSSCDLLCKVNQLSDCHQGQVHLCNACLCQASTLVAMPKDGWCQAVQGVRETILLLTLIQPASI